MSSMLEHDQIIHLRLPTGVLTQTNPFLDEAYITKLVGDLKSQQAHPDNFSRPLIVVMVNKNSQLVGYCIKDGNHHHEALRRAGIPMVEVDALVSDGTPCCNHSLTPFLCEGSRE